MVDFDGICYEPNVVENETPPGSLLCRLYAHSEYIARFLYMQQTFCTKRKLIVL